MTQNNDKQLALVSFEQAKRLKEAGFDWPCNDNYYECERTNLNPLGNPNLGYSEKRNHNRKKQPFPPQQ